MLCADADDANIVAAAQNSNSLFIMVFVLVMCNFGFGRLLIDTFYGERLNCFFITVYEFYTYSVILSEAKNLSQSVLMIRSFAALRMTNRADM